MRFLWWPLLLSVALCFFNIYAGSVAGEKYSNTVLIPSVETETFTHNFYHVCKNVVFIVASGCTGVLLVFIGRKPLLIVGQALMSIALLSLYTVDYADWNTKLGMASVTTFLIGFNVGTATILWIYMSDTLNDTGVMVAAFSIWVFFGGQLRGVPWAAVDTWNYATLFMILFVVSLVGITFFIVFVYETKGKTQT